MPKQIKMKEEEMNRISIKKNPDKIPSPERVKPHSASLKREYYFYYIETVQEQLKIE
jgi:hypothetical protein